LQYAQFVNSFINTYTHYLQGFSYYGKEDDGLRLHYVQRRLTCKTQLAGKTMKMV